MLDDAKKSGWRERMETEAEIKSEEKHCGKDFGRTGKKDLKIAAVLLLLIFLQLVRIVYVFVFEKEGWHSDEVWGYGLANSHCGPYIYADVDPLTDKYENEWIDGSVFKNYITVQEGERFSYDAVIYNLKNDCHPPFYFIILHTVCSFFPEKFSFWYGFSINIVCFIITQLFLFMLSKRMTKSSFWGLAAVAFYGFSVGALDTFVFVRHYAMLVMFTVISMYLHTVLFSAEDKRQFKRTVAALFAVTLAGCLTHYYFVVLAFGISVCFCLRYMYKKQWGRFAAYSVAMLLAVFIFSLMSNGMSYISSPAQGAGASSSLGLIGGLSSFLGRVVDIFFSPAFSEWVEIVLGCLLYDLFGYTGSTYIPFAVFSAFALIILLAAVTAAGAYAIAEKSKDTEGGLYRLSVKYCRLLKRAFKGRFLICTFLFVLLFELYIITGTSDVFAMGTYTDRYIFLIYPLVIFSAMLIIKKIIGKIVSRLKLEPQAQNKFSVIASTVCILTALAVNNANAECLYTFPRPDNDITIESLVKGKDCVLSLSAHWTMTCYASLLSEAGNVFVTDSYDITKQGENLKERTQDVILIIDVDKLLYAYADLHDIKKSDVAREDVEQYYIDSLTEVYGEKPEYLMQDEIFTRKVFVYRAGKEM